MAEAFATTYNKHYQWNCIKKIEPILPVNYKEIALGKDDDIWFVEQKLNRKYTDPDKLAEAIAAIKKMQKKRLWSIYQMDYCREVVAKTDQVDQHLTEQSFENALFDYCKKLYGPKQSKLLPPLPTSKRVFGYIKPTKMYTPLTTYQKCYGEIGYLNILNKH